MKVKKSIMVRAEKYQANFFQYVSLGWIAFALPRFILYHYMKKRFYEQSMENQRRFEKLGLLNKKRRAKH